MDDAFQFRTENSDENISFENKNVHLVSIIHPIDENSLKTISYLSKYKSFVHEMTIITESDESAFEIFTSVVPSGCDVQFVKILYVSTPTRACQGVIHFPSSVEAVHIITPEDISDINCSNLKTKVRISNLNDETVHIFGIQEVDFLTNSEYLDEDESVVYLNHNIICHSYPEKTNIYVDETDITYDKIDVIEYSTIDLISKYGEDEIEINLEINEETDFIKVANIPKNLIFLRFGEKLSRSMISCSSLPQFLSSYHGPYLYNQTMPDFVTNLSLLNTKYSIPYHLMKIPGNLVSLTIKSDVNISDLDSIRLPNGLNYLNLDGKTDISLSNLELPQNINIKKSVWMKNNNFSCEKFKENRDMVVLKSTEKVNDLIKNKMISSIPNLHIDNDMTLCEIWTGILMDGIVQVGNLLIDSSNKNFFNNSHKVFDRSFKLNRPIAFKSLIIRNLTYTEEMNSSLLSLARSLVNIYDIIIRIEFKNEFNQNLIRPMAKLNGMSSVNIGGEFIYSSLNGAIESSIYYKDNNLFIKKGQGYKKFNKLISSSSSGLLVPLIEKPEKSIKLYLWSRCGYCVRQKDIIEEINSEKFDRIVKIFDVDDPNTLDDYRIRSFPTWVVNDTLLSGVKSKDEILNMLDS